MRVGGIQLSASTMAVEENLERIIALAREAKSRYPDLALLAFPELATTGYECGRSFHDVAVSWPDGGYLPRLAALAREIECVLVVGYAERLGAIGLTADSAVVIDRDGRMVGSYRKTHCLNRELRWFVNGSRLRVFQTAAGRFGVLICWDAAMPEAARTYALQGAELIVVIGAWEDPYINDWNLVCAARAYDNVLPVVAVNRTGTEGDTGFSGSSRVIDCLGQVLASVDAGHDRLVTAVIDTEQLPTVRAGYGSQLHDRRPELYQMLVRQVDDPPPEARETWPSCHSPA